MRSFCLTLLYTGARISEVLALVPTRIDPVSGVVIIRSLKKRRDMMTFAPSRCRRALLEELAFVERSESHPNQRLGRRSSDLALEPHLCLAGSSRT